MVEQADAARSRLQRQLDRVLRARVAKMREIRQFVQAVLSVVHEHIDVPGQRERGRMQFAGSVPALAKCERMVVGEVGDLARAVAYSESEGAAALVRDLERHHTE